MSIEQTLIPALAAATGEHVRSLHGEQLTDLLPARVPLIIVARTMADWGAWQTTCGPELGIADVIIQIDYYALTLEAARRLADHGRGVVAGLLGAAPESEFDVWEAPLRVHRVTASYNVPDYSPAVI